MRVAGSGEKPETLIYGDAGGGAMRMRSIEEGSVIVTRMDGRPSFDQGVARTRWPTLAVKAVSRMRYTWTFFREGRPFVRGVNTLARNGASFEEVSWRVTDPARRVILHYDRQ